VLEILCRDETDPATKVEHILRPLRENLERVLLTAGHDIEDIVKKVVRHVLMKQIPHGYTEHSPRLAPVERDGEAVGVEYHRLKR
jgi:hypothetical protein